MTAKEICQKLQQIHKTSYEIFLQNGKEAGQSINHVHLHLVPNSRSIEFLERKEEEVRSEEDMAKEAEQYRSCFEQSNQ
jgi:diadenosine tetraphosphate (Ap4A) HIT family hydrolase